MDDQVRLLAERLVAVRKITLVLEDRGVGALAHTAVEGAQRRKDGGVVERKGARRLTTLDQLSVLGLGLHDQHQLVHGRVANGLAGILGLGSSVLRNVLGVHCSVQRLLVVLLAKGGGCVHRGARADACRVHTIGGGGSSCCRSLGALAAALGGLLSSSGLGACTLLCFSHGLCLGHCRSLGLFGMAVGGVRVGLLGGLVFRVVLCLLGGLSLGLCLWLSIDLGLRLLGVRVLRVLRHGLGGLGIQLRSRGWVPSRGLGLALCLWLDLCLMVVVLRRLLRSALFRLGRRQLGLGLSLSLRLSLGLLGRALGRRLGLTLLRLLGLGLLLGGLLLLQLVLVVILLVQLVLREGGRL